MLRFLNLQGTSRVSDSPPEAHGGGECDAHSARKERQLGDPALDEPEQGGEDARDDKERDDDGPVPPKAASAAGERDEEADRHGESGDGAEPVHLAQLGLQVARHVLEREEEPDDEHRPDADGRGDPCRVEERSQHEKTRNEGGLKRKDAQNVQRQVAYSANRPPANGPTALPSEMAMPSKLQAARRSQDPARAQRREEVVTHPWYFPRSRTLTTSDTMIMLKLLMPPPPMPAMPRQA